MKKHVSIYLKAFGYGEQDLIPCECCKFYHKDEIRAVDIHHINPKGMGGTKGKDVILNLVALCRLCHDKAHRSYISREDLWDVVRARYEA